MPIFYQGKRNGRSRKYLVVVDRKEAIAEALKMARKDDIIIIAGKGHETYQEIKGKKYPFDDKSGGGNAEAFERLRSFARTYSSYRCYSVYRKRPTCHRATVSSKNIR